MRSVDGDQVGIALGPGGAARRGEQVDIFVASAPGGARLVVARGRVEVGGASGSAIQARLERGASDVKIGMSASISVAPAAPDLDAELGFLDAGAPRNASGGRAGSASGGEYLGCFKDTSQFDLDGHLERSATNTPQRCIAKCRELGFRFAAVQYGESCLCGNTYGRYGPATNCDYACTGDASQRCGGYSANSVYAAGGSGVLHPPTPPPPSKPPMGGELDGKGPDVCVGFTGRWKTDYGDLELTVQGGQATGSYPSYQGKIRGTVNGRLLEGRWIQPNHPPGWLRFELSADGRTFHGTWTEEGGGGGGNWNGRCAEEGE